MTELHRLEWNNKENGADSGFCKKSMVLAMLPMRKKKCLPNHVVNQLELVTKCPFVVHSFSREFFLHVIIILIEVISIESSK